MKIKLVQEKKIKVPTLAGWVVIGIFLFALLCAFVAGINPFLSLNKPVDTKVMVVEGWLPDYAIKEALDEFNRNHYSLCITAGIAIDKGFFLSQYATYAQLAAETLKKLGMDSSKLAVVSSPEVKVDRTFACACAVRAWIQKSGLSINGINVISLGPHSRRTLLLYRHAFNSGKREGDRKPMRIGIESFDDITYDRSMWWKRSNGFRAVTDELIAYLYARLVFVFK